MLIKAHKNTQSGFGDNYGHFIYKGGIFALDLFNIRQALYNETQLRFLRPIKNGFWPHKPKKEPKDKFGGFLQTFLI